MRGLFVAAIAGIVISIFSAYPVIADDASIDVSKLTSDAAYQDLTLDASRAELFGRIVAFQEAKAPQIIDEVQPFNLSGPFRFPLNARFDDGKPRENSSDLDFTTLKNQKIDFVYMKATQGVGFKDSKFPQFWDAAESAGLLRGAYHFLSFQTSGTDQGTSFAKFIGLHGGFRKQDLPPVMDLEWDIAVANGPDRWAGQTPRQIIDKALDCMKTIEAATITAGAPKIPILYTSKAWIDERNIPAEEFKRLERYRIWIADYSRSHRAVEQPAVIHAAPNMFWQFTAAAKLDVGYPGGLDANIYKGTQAEFDRDFQLAPH